MPRDCHNDMKYSILEPPQVANTGDTAFVSTILDTQGFDANEAVWIVVSPDSDATLTPLLEDSDDSGMSGNVAVADAYLLGTEALATEGASVTTGICYKLGYIGLKRYLRLTLTPANNTGNLYVAGVWAQGSARSLPQSDQSI